MTQIKTLTHICLVRHGETDWNKSRRLQGSTDIPLNATGVRQAQATAARLAEERFEFIYSSPLRRAYDTAQSIAQRHALPIHTEQGLSERNYGSFQGFTHEEAGLRHPELQARVRARERDAAPPEGESLNQFSRRVTDTLSRLAASHAGTRLLVVAHGGVLDIAYRLATGMPLEAPRDFSIGNACINWIACDGEDWQMLDWNDQAHLSTSLDELPL